MRVFSDFSPEVEALSLDEAFLDMTGSEQLFGDPQSIGRRLKQAIHEATGGLTASVGLSATKFVAKVASARRKPDGLTVVPPEQAQAWLAPLSVSWLWGVGPKNQARFHHMGLYTIGEVARADPALLSAKLGRAGLHFHALAQAEDPRQVSGRRTSKIIGSEHTLDRDVRDKGDIKFHLRRSAEIIGMRLRQKCYVTFGVGVKLKTTKFHILTRQRRLTEPTDVTERFYSVGVELLNEFDHPGPFRLVGMTAYDLAGCDDRIQLGLFGTTARQRRLEVAIDELAARFGPDVVQRANDLTKPPGERLAPVLDFLDDRKRG